MQLSEPFAFDAQMLVSLLLDGPLLLNILSALFLFIGSHQIWLHWAESAQHKTATDTDVDASGARLSTPCEMAGILLTGLSSGFLQGLSTIAGPPVTVYLLAHPLPQSQFRGAVSAFFAATLALNLGTLTYHTVHTPGALQPHQLLPMLAASLLGVACGTMLGTNIRALRPDPRAVRLAIIVLLFVSIASMGSIPGVASPRSTCIGACVPLCSANPTPTHSRASSYLSQAFRSSSPVCFCSRSKLLGSPCCDFTS